jgi:hypothetical protein
MPQKLRVFLETLTLEEKEAYHLWLEQDVKAIRKMKSIVEDRESIFSNSGRDMSLHYIDLSSGTTKWDPYLRVN